MSTRIVTEPTVEPLTLAEVKTHLHEDLSDASNDALITNLTAEENLLLKEAHTLTQTEEALRDNQMAYDLDQEERDIAQAALDFLPADVAALINVRNPIVE